MKLDELLSLAGGGTVEGGKPDAEITGVSSLHDALPGDVSFLANPKYAKQIETTQASAVFVSKDFQGAAPAGTALLRVDSPDRAFGVAVPLFTKPPIVHAPGIHPTAVIAANVTLGKDVHIGPYAVIGEGTTIGDRTVIEAHVVVAEECVIGADVHLYPMVSIRERCRIGDRTVLHNGVVIGADGFGYSWTRTPEGGINIVKIPQLGNVVIGNDVEIGANTTIDRARFGSTIVGPFNKIDNLVQFGHNVRTGAYCGVCAHVGIAGSTHLGNGNMLWGQVGLAGHITTADGVEVMAQSGVSGSLTKPGRYLGSPAVPMKDALRLMHVPKVVENLQKQVADLQAQLKALQEKLA